MMKLAAFLLSFAFVATAQAQTYPSPNFGHIILQGTGSAGDISGMTTIVPGGSVAQTQAARAIRTYDPRDYGANYTGTSQTISSKLGLTTKAAIAAYTVNSVQPYAWLTANSNFNYFFNRRPMGDTPSGSTTLVFPSVLGIPTGSTAVVSAASGIANGTYVASTTVQGAVSPTGTASSGSTSLTVSSNTGLVVGELVPTIAGIAYNTSISAISGTTVTLSQATVGAVSGTLSFPAVGVVNLSAATTALIKGDLTGAAVAAIPYIINITQTLTDAQAAAGEMDWYGTQAAIQAAKASTLGTGLVQIPNARGIMDNSSNVGSGVGTLIIPEAYSAIAGTLGNPIDIAGYGKLSSQLYWPTDLGIGRAGIVAGNPNGTWANAAGRYATGAYYYGRIHDLTLNGIGSSTITPGTQTAQMDGAWLGARRDLSAIEVQHFNAGISYVGDNVLISDVETAQNHCGMRFQPQNVTLSGTYTWSRVRSVNNDLAGICIARNAIMAQMLIDSLDLTADPYGILVEPGIQDTTGGSGIGGDTTAALANVRFSNTFAQTLGNALYWDDNFTTADGTNRGPTYRAAYQTVFDTPLVGLSATYTISGGGTGRGPYAYVGINVVADLEFLHVQPYSWNAITGTQMLVYANYIAQQSGGLIFSGDPSAFTQANIPIQGGSQTSIYDGLEPWKGNQIEYPGVWKGYTEIVNTSGNPTIAVGDVLEQVGSGNGAQLSTASVNGIFGVAVQAMSTASTGNVVALATSGRLVNVLVTTNPAIGTWIKKGASGVAVAGAGPSDTGSIGFVSGACTGSANPYTCPTQLKFSN